MVRWYSLAAASAVVIGAAFVTGASLPHKSLDEPLKQDTVKTLTLRTQKIGFFNMAKIMKEYRKGLWAVEQLKVRKDYLNKNLIGMREMYKALQNKPKESDPNLREESIREQVVLGRKIEDLDREINKILNNQAATIIAELYDDVHAMIVELAHDRGLTVVFSYPDAVTPADEENPLLKEAKLKPPAAQPLYIDPSADYTDELLERLNAKFPVERDEN